MIPQRMPIDWVPCYVAFDARLISFPLMSFLAIPFDGQLPMSLLHFSRLFAVVGWMCFYAKVVVMMCWELAGNWVDRLRRC